jgi:flavin reductase (DIM6/NTAB) family NADH-FMN oxidoreductase RutF
MSHLTDIPLDQFDPRIFKLWSEDWLLLTAGDLAGNRFNTMAVAWGGFGVMWTLPIAMIVVRPQRHTRSFLDAAAGFTLCAFPEAHRKALAYCGAHSGRDVDKMRETGLNPLASAHVAAPGYAEADLWIECRKLYFNDFDPANFLDPRIAKNYPDKDYHRMYFGEVLAVRSVAASH